VERIDVAVIGAGVSGLAAARAIAARGFSTCVLERHPRPGLDTSTHNSGVIHAGLYYPAGSLKARLCVEGRQLLYTFCARHDVPHRRCGKIVIANDESETRVLEALLAIGNGNHVDGLEIVDARFIANREPHVRAVAALYSPESGIVDAESYVKALLRTGEAEGVIFLPASRVVGAEPIGEAVAIRTDRETILADQVVNAAGLYADDVSHLLGGETFKIYPCRGEYAELTPSKRNIVNHLVYPVPDPSGHGLGVHLVKTLAGDVWLGPTIKYQDRKDDYEGDRLPADAFVAPAQRILKDIEFQDLRLSGSGIRAKLHPPTESFADFFIARDRKNPAVVQVAGIDSPGLTSSLAIGAMAAELVERRSTIG
jgi:L-2-hydroxyglutarate oxidase LhgO